LLREWAVQIVPPGVSPPASGRGLGRASPQAPLFHNNSPSPSPSRKREGRRTDNGKPFALELGDQGANKSSGTIDMVG
jgi:hypothetical protein